MFHNVLMTTLTPMRNTDEIQSLHAKQFSTIWPEVKQEKSKDTSVKKSIKKKKRNRTLFTTEQVRMLEKIFVKSKYIDIERRKEISDYLQIDQKCIKIWFQNRRMKDKKELSESCDSMSESQVTSLNSVSPPLESPQRLNNESDNGYILPSIHSEAKLPNYYYNTPNNIKSEVHQEEQQSYGASNSPIIPEYVNYNHFNPSVFRNGADYYNSIQYYRPQTEYQYYYNIGDMNNQYATGNFHDWPANMYDTSYF